jgi:anti-sigma factor RsiW
MNTSHDWTERLSSYLDGDLAKPEQLDLEAHLETCATCRQALEGLRAIIAAAPEYRGEAPAADLWPGIAAQIEASRTVAFPTPARLGRRWGWPARMAAAIGLMAIGAGGAWWALGTPGVDRSPEVASLRASRDPNLMFLAGQAYHAAVADLQRTLEEGRDRLAPETMATIERSLTIIDQAIAEAEAALAADPASPDLPNWIAANQWRKLDLLRRAAQAVAASHTES